MSVEIIIGCAMLLVFIAYAALAITDIVKSHRRILQEHAEWQARPRVTYRGPVSEAELRERGYIIDIPNEPERLN